MYTQTQSGSLVAACDAYAVSLTLRPGVHLSVSPRKRTFWRVENIKGRLQELHLIGQVVIVLSTGFGLWELVEVFFFNFGVSVTLFRSNTPKCALKQGDGSPATVYPLKTESSSWPFFRILCLE